MHASCRQQRLMTDLAADGNAGHRIDRRLHKKLAIINVRPHLILRKQTSLLDGPCLSEIRRLLLSGMIVNATCNTGAQNRQPPSTIDVGVHMRMGSLPSFHRPCNCLTELAHRLRAANLSITRAKVLSFQQYCRDFLFNIPPSCCLRRLSIVLGQWAKTPFDHLASVSTLMMFHCYRLIVF